MWRSGGSLYVSCTRWTSPSSKLIWSSSRLVVPVMYIWTVVVKYGLIASMKCCQNRGMARPTSQTGHYFVSKHTLLNIAIIFLSTVELRSETKPLRVIQTSIWPVLPLADSHWAKLPPSKSGSHCLVWPAFIFSHSQLPPRAFHPDSNRLVRLDQSASTTAGISAVAVCCTGWSRFTTSNRVSVCLSPRDIWRDILPNRASVSLLFDICNRHTSLTWYCYSICFVLSPLCSSRYFSSSWLAQLA